MNEPLTPAALDSERPRLRDIYEVARLPALFAILTAAVTWLIWYYTNTPCTLELAERTSCNPATVARYIGVDIYGRMLTYSAITAAAGGVWNYNMFTKMRAQIAAERQRADEAIKQLAEYRRQADEERRQTDEERRQTDEERRQERDTFMALLAEERRRSDENQQAFMAALSDITSQMAQLMQQRNGNYGDSAGDS